MSIDKNSPPHPYALWKQANGDRDKYLALMIKHGLLIQKECMACVDAPTVRETYTCRRCGRQLTAAVSKVTPMKIEIEDRMPNDRTAVMQALLESDPEAWACLQGAVAILALPSVRCEDRSQATRLIEIEVEPDVWEVADRVTFAERAVIFAQGVNGHTKRYTFDLGAIPQWRLAGR